MTVLLRHGLNHWNRWNDLNAKYSDRLLHRHAFGKISRLVDVRAAMNGDIVGKQLQRNTQHDRRKKMRSFGYGQHAKGRDLRGELLFVG